MLRVSALRFGRRDARNDDAGRRRVSAGLKESHFRRFEGAKTAARWPVETRRHEGRREDNEGLFLF
jgi:hypothetical protein